LHKIRSDSTEKDTAQERGIGVYSYNQIKNTKLVGRVGAMLVGLLYVIWGLARLHEVVVFRTAEAKAFGSAESHVGAFIVAFTLMAIGIFVGHVGVIYYSRKLRHWASKVYSSRAGSP
jgi:uncharacterized membrane protein YuzA (DUF378 family)